MASIGTELTALAVHLQLRRESVLNAWHDTVKRDPALNTGDSLPKWQLYDHIPALLWTFERELRRLSGTPGEELPDVGQESAAAHGLQRWQQGYDLPEVTRELGRLNESVVEELEEYARTHQQLEHDVMATARRLWAALCSTCIEQSSAQYFRLQQMEAAGHVRDLERALDEIRQLEQQRAELWREAAHDLRGNLGVVANATAGLSMQGLQETQRETVLRMLRRNVRSLRHLLDDVTGLARLQAGAEHRQLSTVDVAALLQELCDDLRPLAQERRLFLQSEGPAPFMVATDPIKTRRIAQNLVLNAIRYTTEGSVTVSWGDSAENDAKRWALSVIDTGPGFQTGSAAPLAQAIEGATEPAAPGELRRELDAHRSEPDSVPPAAPAHSPTPRGGEGIGLSIVKRLCDLLDASIELHSAAGVGTRFRILLPRQYVAP